MKVINRHGISEEISFDKIKNRIEGLINFNSEDKLIQPLTHVDANYITIQTINKLHDNITTRQLDIESAKVCANLESVHYNYGLAGGRILSSDLFKYLKSLELNSYSDRVTYINNKLPTYLNKDFYQFVINNQDKLNSILQLDRNFLITYFGFKTLEKSYLVKYNDQPIETPQDMFLRVSIAIHYRSEDLTLNEQLEYIKSTYDYMSSGYFTHATPTLFNAGTNYEQMSSCYLIGTEDDLGTIFKTVADVGQISKWAGGIGIHISNIRGKGSLIHSTNGKSDGIIPMIKVYNEVARYVSQGGKRKGSIAMYLEPWHIDIEQFLDLKKNTGAETERARDIFTALWIPDEFMTRVINDDDWYLMCPSVSVGLTDLYGKEFSELYLSYIESKRYIKKVKARELFQKALESQIETGVPYILFKDNINRKSNQSNIGTVKSSNLCVHEDTKILTKDGYIKISKLENKEVNVWNGFEWSKVMVKKTATNQNLVRVTLSNGAYLDCTPQHKFYIKDGSNITEIEKGASDLQIGDVLIDYKLPEPDTFNEIIYDNYDTSIPLNESIDFKIKWFDTFVKCYGVTCDNLIFIENQDKELLINLRLMLHTLKVETQIICTDQQQIEPSWRLLIDKTFIDQLVRLGFEKTNQFFNLKMNYKYDTNISIVSVKDSYENVDTYCFTEEKRHLGMFNGILTGQCAEITEVSTSQEYAVCNLGSIAVNRFVKYDQLELLDLDSLWSSFMDQRTSYFIDNGILQDIFKSIYDFDKLIEVSRILTYNLNNIIDYNYYPVNETRISNMKNRPIGLGVQGLGDLYYILNIPYSSYIAKYLDALIMETIYYGSIYESSEIALTRGKYKKYDGSPFSEGKFQFDLWLEENKFKFSELYPQMHNWDMLKEKVKITGMANSLLTALMPTASTSQILGNNECFEPYSSNIYKRTTLAGEFQVVNRHLINRLCKMNLWNENLRTEIIKADGSIQNLNLEQNLKDVYKTIWEIKQKDVIDHALARGPYVDQSQSMNLFFANPNFQTLYSALIYGWKNGLKTGCYYLRSKPAIEAIKFSVSNNNDNKQVVCTDEVCTTCSA
jgi:ribonucleotide reductase alpha subunit